MRDYKERLITSINFLIVIITVLLYSVVFLIYGIVLLIVCPLLPSKRFYKLYEWMDEDSPKIPGEF